MIETIALSTVAVVLVAVVVYRFWPDRSARNVIALARQRNAQRRLRKLSFAQLKRLAERGVGAAQYQVGLAYATGDGIPVDEQTANYWWERAAASGVVDAAYCLALQHERGRGTPVDYPLALRLYEKAARAGNADAQCNLGVMFLQGKGVDKSAIHAAAWLVRAKAQGHAQATDNLEWLVQTWDDAATDADHAEIQSLERSAARNDADALMVLGWMSATGFAREQDLASADELYGRAQNRGHVFAHVLRAQLAEQHRTRFRVARPPDDQ